MDRGQGFHQPNQGRSGGPHFSHSAGQPHRNQGRGRGRGRSSLGRGENCIYVEKRKEGPQGESFIYIEKRKEGPQGESFIYIEKRKEGLQGESFIYVEKRKEGPIPSEPMSGVSPSSSSPAPMSGGRAQISQIPADVTTENKTLSCDFSTNKIDMSRKQVETSRPLMHGDKSFGPSPVRDPRTPESDGKYENSEQSGVFDICRFTTSVPKLKRSLLDINRERRNEIQDVRTEIVLRPGMVLIKRYIPLREQVEIVKRCRDLGIGPGGFYQPGYEDGAKLNLKMMCLGKNWDPETGNYGDHRPSDDSKPPVIPVEFYQLVEKTIRDSHSAIERESNAGNAVKLLPWMTPDICLANFYSTTGRLGLHQDRDESQGSIRKGLPVVSFSIGDSADFLYSDHRDVDNADKVVLASGDVLIFGGQSRNIFHGVTAIHPNTAPKALLEQTNLRPGRLNLTFRQY